MTNLFFLVKRLYTDLRIDCRSRRLSQHFNKIQLVYHKSQIKKQSLLTRLSETKSDSVIFYQSVGFNHKDKRKLKRSNITA